MHWAKFSGSTLQETWDTPHRQEQERNVVPPTENSLPLWIASVVPQQLQLWQSYPGARVIMLDQVPLQGMYPTLGLDRALAVWGAGTRLGWPVLVIDGGTALTFTGADRQQKLVGGAILPGLGLQLRTLAQQTADLPLVTKDNQLPKRWALDTPSAIQSGVLYTIAAGMRDFIEQWWREFPGSPVVLTGGDRTVLGQVLAIQFPKIADGITTDPHLIFWGIEAMVTETIKN